MELIERAPFLKSLQAKVEQVDDGEGHCMLICGEAGMGKTSLIKAFCNSQKNVRRFYIGSCDALFAPRPLAPLYDITWQLGKETAQSGKTIDERAELFANFFYELEQRNDTSVVIIEDIHWADEATLDFIKFFARRITRLPCLLLLTYRDDEIHSRHPLRTLLGQVPRDHFTRVQLPPLSREAVEQLATERGYKGEDVYLISHGNPFYVNEILASYNSGIPDNIKDSVLSYYNRLDETTKQLCQLMSVMPTGLEVSYVQLMHQEDQAAMHHCLDLKILVHNGDLITFKHELYRRTIETSLSPLLRIKLNNKVLDLLLPTFEQNNQPEKIIHYAKNSNENDLVVKYAPIAAKRAASMGAHIEASKLYLSAIEYYAGTDQNILIQFYEGYAYECYLTNQIKEAIIYATKSLNLWKQKNNWEKMGSSMRFLSRLWWFDGNRKKAEDYSAQAMELFNDQPASIAKAMALSNLSQLKMLADEPDECIHWGQKAIAMARDLGDEETLCHALNNVGTMQSRMPSLRPNGIEMLQQSLEIALQYGYQEHAARAYTNLGISGVVTRDYEFAKKTLEQGIQYCEEHDLDSWLVFLHSAKARMMFAMGNWERAYAIAENIVKREGDLNLAKVDALSIMAKRKMRNGEPDVLPLLVQAQSIASEATELQRMIPALVACLEYEWITGNQFIAQSTIEHVVSLIEKAGNIHENTEFAHWLWKARKHKAVIPEFFDGYKLDTPSAALAAARIWKQLGCPYEQALALFEANEEEKKTALTIMHRLGASTIVEKMKLEMRTSGIKSIPRGTRKTMRINAANLTERELDILYLLKDGLQNKEIASRLFISAKTVDNHVSSIFYKLEVNTRTKAVQEASQLGILK